MTRLLAPALAVVLAACGPSEPEEPRIFLFDPPQAPAARGFYDTWIAHQYVTRLTPEGPSAEDRIHYTGGRLIFQQTAWDPQRARLYSYAVNEKPGQTWLVSVSVPDLERRALARIPPSPRRHDFSPLLAYDDRHERLVVTHGRSPCGGKMPDVWHVYDVAAGTWTPGAAKTHAFVTLDYDPVEDVLVSVGVDREARRPVVAKLDVQGKLVSQVEADLCAALEPRIHGYDRQTWQSQLVAGTVQVYRHVYYGEDAEDGVYFELQRYDVDVASGEVRRIR